MHERKYPIGIQTFSEIRKGGYVYIDKTDLVWRLANEAKYIFLNPVIHFDISRAKNKATSSELQRALLIMMKPLAQDLGLDIEELTPGLLLIEMIRHSYEKTGKQVVVIIDEYDSPIQNVLNEEEKLPEFRRVMQAFAHKSLGNYWFESGTPTFLFKQMQVFHADITELEGRTAREALEQIDTKGYAIPYQTDGRKVVKVGVNFSSETKTLTDWVIVNS